MSITSNNKGNKSALEQAQANIQAKNQNAASAQGKPTPTTGTLAERLSGPMARHGGEGRYSELVKAFETIRDDSARNGFLESVKFIKLDKATSQLPYSVIILTAEEDDVVAVTMLPVVGTNDHIASEVKEINGQTIDVLVTAGDLAHDQLVWSIAMDAVRPYFASRHVTYVRGGFIPIQSCVSADDLDRVQGVMYDAVMSSYGSVMKEFEQPSMALQDFVGNSKLEISPVVGDSTGETSTGILNRSDITITLEEVSGKKGGPSYHSKRTKLTTTSAYVDLTYFDNPNKVTGPYAQQQVQNVNGIAPTVTYRPRLIATEINHETGVVNLPLRLLGISMMSVMHKDNSWSSVFLNKGSELRDIGAVGYEVPLPINADGKGNINLAKIDTKSNNFTQVELAQLLHSTVLPSLIYTVTVEETGAHSWVDKTFIRAAEGDNGAISEIIEAADNLTGGRFSKKWDKNKLIVSPTMTRIHLGEWVSPNGPADIRDLDYLAMLNIEKTNLSALTAYTNTFTDTSIPEEIRLSQRLRIMESTLGTINVTGYAVMVDINAEFIHTLNEAIADSNVSPVIKGAHQIDTGVRPSGNFGRFAATSEMQTRLYNNQGYAGYNQPGNPQAVSSRTW